MASFQFVSFIIGLLLGAIIMLLLVWIGYYTRSFIFTYCPEQARPCGGADYYNNPGNALANNSGLTAGSILFLKDDKLYYTRVPKNTNCVPESNQTIPIIFPQYCSFGNPGQPSLTYRQTFFNSNIYKPDNGIPGVVITTSGNCDPVPGQELTTGIPLVEWDPVPLT